MLKPTSLVIGLIEIELPSAPADLIEGPDHAADLAGAPLRQELLTSGAGTPRLLPLRPRHSAVVRANVQRANLQQVCRELDAELVQLKSRARRLRQRFAS